MTEWCYKATPTKVSFQETHDLAVDDGFICRSAYEENTTRADNTRHVRLNDVIHFYFTGDGPPRVIGSFEVVGPRRHAKAMQLGAGVKGTALHEVTDTFAERLLAMGDADAERYRSDPFLKKVTGWPVIRRDDISTPPFSSAPFKGQATLVRR